MELLYGIIGLDKWHFLQCSNCATVQIQYTDPKSVDCLGNAHLNLTSTYLAFRIRDIISWLSYCWKVFELDRIIQACIFFITYFTMLLHIWSEIENIGRLI